MGHIGKIRSMARPNIFPSLQDETSRFVCQQAAKALPQLRVLGCDRASAKFFYLHLSDPFGKASLLLPVATEWVEEYELDCDSSVCRLERAFHEAAKILDFSGPATP